MYSSLRAVEIYLLIVLFLVSLTIVEFVVVVQLLNRVRLFVTTWTAARQASLPFTVSQSLLKLMSIELGIPSNHLILCRPLLLLPSVFPSIKVFSNKSALWVLVFSSQSIVQFKVSSLCSSAMCECSSPKCLCISCDHFPFTLLLLFHFYFAWSTVEILGTESILILYL